jgi:5-methylcytosine-specific restriction endonuclease McrA
VTCGFSRKKYIDTFDIDLDVHHVVPLSWFEQRYDPPELYRRANDKENLLTMCRQCHTDWTGIAFRPPTLSSLADMAVNHE